jgi:ribosomal protein S18 acetylase RimI-like enzyme
MAVERGLARITLETGAANDAARAFYAALGYREEDVRLSRALR